MAEAASRPPGRARRATATAVLPLLMALAVPGCSDRDARGPAVDDAARPAVIHTVGGGDPVTKLRLPGLVRSARRAELSFDVPGFLAEFPRAEGSRVRAGEVVARLDDEIYRADLAAARAEHERARTDAERYERLWESERAVARSEVDERRSRLELANTKLKTAERHLADAVIRAPFSGVLTRRRVEAFTSVQAKQPVADLQDLGALEVVVAVPERVVRSRRPQSRALAVIDDASQRSVPLTLKSWAAEADPLTQTYEVVLAMRDLPRDAGLLPGMSVTVLPFAEAAATARGDAPVSVPLSAVFSDADGRRAVWVVGDDGRVARRVVEPGEIAGGSVAVASGLRHGERIVVAGVSALREGMKVRSLDAR